VVGREAPRLGGGEGGQRGRGGVGAVRVGRREEEREGARAEQQGRVRGVPRGEVGPRGERRAEPEGEAARGGGRVGAPELHVVERERVEAVGARVHADEVAVAHEAERRLLR